MILQKAMKINLNQGVKMPMNNFHSKLFVMALTVLFISGCSKPTGIVGSDRVSNEQINTDLATKSMPVTRGEDWDFSKDSMRCFKLNETESTFSATEANLVLLVVAAQGDMNAKLGTGVTLDTVLGELRLSYKKNGGSWGLEGARPDLSRERVAEDHITKFFELAAPVCSYFDMKKPKASK